MGIIRQKHTKFAVAQWILSADPLSEFVKRKIEKYLEMNPGVILPRSIVLDSDSRRVSSGFLTRYLIAIRSIPGNASRMNDIQALYYVRKALLEDTKAMRKCFGLKLTDYDIVVADRFDSALLLFWKPLTNRPAVAPTLDKGGSRSAENGMQFKRGHKAHSPEMNLAPPPKGPPVG